jgi:DNA-directed RNA polymerase subunit L
MRFEYVKEEKNEVDIETDSMTIAELLRAYLSKDDSVKFVAWKREHPTKAIVLKVKTSGKTARKAISDSVAKIEKEVDSLVDSFKKSK